jgi:hypothetical protein
MRRTNHLIQNRKHAVILWISISSLLIFSSFQQHQHQHLFVYGSTLTSVSSVGGGGGGGGVPTKGSSSSGISNGTQGRGGSSNNIGSRSNLLSSSSDDSDGYSEEEGGSEDIDISEHENDNGEYESMDPEDIDVDDGIGTGIGIGIGMNIRRDAFQGQGQDEGGGQASPEMLQSEITNSPSALVYTKASSSGSGSGSGDDGAVPTRASHDSNGILHGKRTISPSMSSEHHKSTSSVSASASSSQPLRTLKKLQAMLEDTDYATATSSSSSSSTKSSPSPITQVPSIGTSSTSSKSESLGDEHPSLPTTVYQTKDDEYAREKVVEDRQSQSQGSGSGSSSSSSVGGDLSGSESGIEGGEEKEMDRLWTSQDRSKYKKQQRRLLRDRDRINLERIQREREQEQLQQHVHVHVHVLDDDTEVTDATEDSTDDGLGYTLPNLPIYNSDAESTDEMFETEFDSESSLNKRFSSQSAPPLSLQPIKHENSVASPSVSPPLINPNASLSSTPPYPTQQYNQFQGNTQHTPIQQGQGPPYQYNRSLQNQQQQYHHSQQPPHYNHPQQQQQYQYPQQIPGQHPYSVNNPYPEQQPSYMYANPQAYANMNQPHLQQTQQQYPQSWSSHSHSPPQTLPPGYAGPGYYPPHGSHQQQHRQFQPQPVAVLKGMQQTKFDHSKSTSSALTSPTLNQAQEKDSDVDGVKASYMGNTQIDSKITLAEAGTLISFDSIQKMFFFLTGVMLLCYCAVSPRTLELVEYNDLFRRNVQNVALVFIGPILIFLSVFDAKDNDINALVSVKD